MISVLASILSRQNWQKFKNNLHVKSTSFYQCLIDFYVLGNKPLTLPEAGARQKKIVILLHSLYNKHNEIVHNSISDYLQRYDVVAREVVMECRLDAGYRAGLCFHLDPRHAVTVRV